MKTENQIEERLEWAREKADERDSWYFDGWVAALEWALKDNELVEKFGRRFETCPVKDADCDEGPFYGIMLLAHMKEEHPDAYDAVTRDEASP